MGAPAIVSIALLSADETKQVCHTVPSPSPRLSPRLSLCLSPNSIRSLKRGTISPVDARRHQRRITDLNPACRIILLPSLNQYTCSNSITSSTYTGISAGTHARTRTRISADLDTSS